MGEIKDDREQRKQWASNGSQTWNVTRATKKDTLRGSARPTLLKDIRETDSRRRHNRHNMVRNRLYLPGRIEGNGVSFLVHTGSGVSILAARTWRKWGCAEDELTRYWGQLCSVEGRAPECLGRARLRMDGTKERGIQAVEERFDQCANIRVPPRRGAP